VKKNNNNQKGCDGHVHLLFHIILDVIEKVSKKTAALRKDDILFQATINAKYT
jgi:hypothetical protein